MNTIDRQLLFSQTFPVRWGDMDALGHVNNTIYFRYCEQIRVEWLDSLARPTTIKQTDGPVIIDALCTFHRPVVYPATITVNMYGGKPGRSSFETYYDIINADDNTLLYCTGRAKVVWVDYAANQSLPVPDDLRQQLPQGD